MSDGGRTQFVRWSGAWKIRGAKSSIRVQVEPPGAKSCGAAPFVPAGCKNALLPGAAACVRAQPEPGDLPGIPPGAKAPGPPRQKCSRAAGTNRVPGPGLPPGGLKWGQTGQLVQKNPPGETQKSCPGCKTAWTRRPCTLTHVCSRVHTHVRAHASTLPHPHAYTLARSHASTPSRCHIRTSSRVIQGAKKGC